MPRLTTELESWTDILLGLLEDRGVAALQQIPLPRRPDALEIVRYRFERRSERKMSKPGSVSTSVISTILRALRDNVGHGFPIPRIAVNLSERDVGTYLEMMSETAAETFYACVKRDRSPEFLAAFDCPNLIVLGRCPNASDVEELVGQLARSLWSIHDPLAWMWTSACRLATGGRTQVGTGAPGQPDDDDDDGLHDLDLDTQNPGSDGLSSMHDPDALLQIDAAARTLGEFANDVGNHADIMSAFAKYHLLDVVLRPFRAHP